MPHFIRCIIPNENKEAGTNTPSSVTFVYASLRLSTFVYTVMPLIFGSYLLLKQRWRTLNSSLDSICLMQPTHFIPMVS